MTAGQGGNPNPSQFAQVCARAPTATSTVTIRAMSASLKGFGRRPFAGALGLGAGPVSESLVRRKPREGRGAVWLGGTYGDFGAAATARAV